MKNILKYIPVCLVFFIGCHKIDIDENRNDSPALQFDSEISSVCMVSSVAEDKGPGKPMTKGLIGKETAVSLFGNFLKVEESAPEDWTSEADYDINLTEMPSFENSKICALGKAIKMGECVAIIN